MNHAIGRIKQDIKNQIEHTFHVSRVSIIKPPPNVDADLSIPLQSLAKELGTSAEQQSDAILEALGALGLHAVFERGFINIKLNRSMFLESMAQDYDQKGESYGAQNIGQQANVVMDISSPNVAKPMSVGHLRSTIIGDALYRVLAFAGFATTSINYYADWGTQFGTLLYGFHHWLDHEAYRENPIQELLRIYIEFEKQATENEILRKDARAWSVRLEQQDPQAVSYWEDIVANSFKEFDKIYGELDVTFDHLVGESQFATQAQEIVDDLLARNIAEMSEGCAIVRLEEYGIETPFVLRRSDGATLYSARDIASALWRIRTFNPKKMIYVVGVDQKLHFKQLFATLDKLGYGNIEYIHIDFGLVSLPEGKMSTRKGRVVFLEDLLKESVERAKELAQTGAVSLNEVLDDATFHAIGIGAVKYADLSQNRIKNITFTWEKMLAFEGNSGPYLMYAYARAKRILSQTSGLEKPDSGVEVGDAQWALMLQLARFPEAVSDVVHTLNPHILAHYTYELCQAFSLFYNKVPVLKAEEKERATRLWLVDCFVKTLQTCFKLLNITPVERM